MRMHEMNNAFGKKNKKKIYKDQVSLWWSGIWIQSEDADSKDEDKQIQSTKYSCVHVHSTRTDVAKLLSLDRVWNEVPMTLLSAKRIC